MSDQRHKVRRFRASGAPAVVDDYNYPYQPSAAGVTGPQYFYRLLANKVLWCDTTSPYWPRTTTGATCTKTCTAGVIINSSQTCNAGGATTACCTAIGAPAGCAGVSTYNPAGCRAAAGLNPPLYCGPFGTGSAPECQSCACNNLPTGTNGTCSITGAGCGCVGAGCVPTKNGNPACPDQPTGCTLGGTLVTTCTAPAASAACTSLTWDPVAGVYSGTPPSLMPATTLLQDSNNLGVVCRHNNLVYAVTRRSRGRRPLYLPATVCDAGGQGQCAERRLPREQDGDRAVHAARQVQHVDHRQLPDRRHDASAFRATTTRSTPSSSATASTAR